MSPAGMKKKGALPGGRVTLPASVAVNVNRNVPGKPLRSTRTWHSSIPESAGFAGNAYLYALPIASWK
jgi:hypothetical protein